MKIDSDLLTHDDRGIFPLPKERPDAYHERAQLIYKGAGLDPAAYERSAGEELKSPLYVPMQGVQNAIDRARQRMKDRFKVNLDWVSMFEADMGDYIFDGGKMGFAAIGFEGSEDQPHTIQTFIALNSRLKFSQAPVARHEYIHIIRNHARVSENWRFEELLADIDTPFYTVQGMLQPLTAIHVRVARSRLRRLFKSYGDNVLLRLSQERIFHTGSMLCSTKNLKESICRKAESGNLASQMLMHRAGW